MSYRWGSLGLLVLFLGFVSRSSYAAETYEELFKRGVDAYMSENWHECIAFMHNAIADYKNHNKVVVQCRSKCRTEGESRGPPEIPDNMENLQFYARMLRDTLCIMKCKRRRLGERPNTVVPRYVEEAFDSRQPYDYMQLAYYKIGSLQQAASCAYTFLASNPEHEVMRANLQFYASHADLDVNKVKNLETRTFQELYLMGNEAYNNKKYHEVMHYFEAALEEYYEAEEKCRYLCEGPFDHNGFPEFIMAIANHFTFVLKCKQKCADKLSFMYGEKYDNYVSSHYHYLQFAYFKVGEIRKACEAVETYLLFHPDDETMMHNKKFYTRSSGITEEDFVPSQEAERYVKRDKYEKQLLKYILENYKFDDLLEDWERDHLSRTPNVNVFDRYRSDKEKKLREESETEQKRRLKKRAVDIIRWSQENGIQIVMDENKLNGTQRFVADGFATSEQCEQLMELATFAAVNGDGYNGKPSPHTEFESFEGLTVGRAAMLIKLGNLELDKAYLLINVSERGRDYVEKYFNLNRELFFSYTHLVCRTALPGSSEERSDLSHPVHADNCLLQTSGECLKERPAYTWRDYSAIIYLNDDFDGGEFLFAENKTQFQAQVRPKCGRLVGFSAGKENLHGVRAVFRGRRCALAMWYTLDKSHREKERELAQQVLDQVAKESKSSSSKPVPPPLSEKKAVKESPPIVPATTDAVCESCAKDGSPLKPEPPESRSKGDSKSKARNEPVSQSSSSPDVESLKETSSNTRHAKYHEEEEGETLTNKFSLETFDGYTKHNHKDL